MLSSKRRSTNVTICRRSTIKDDDFFAISKHISNLRDLRDDRNSKSADAAFVWERKSNGYRIVDLQLDRFTEALVFILNHFFSTEPICKATGLYVDALSVRTCMRTILAKMSDMQSLCAVEEGTNALVGVLVASVILREDYTRKSQPCQGPLYKVMSLRSRVVESARDKELLNAEKFLSIDALCVESSHQKKGIGTSLLRSSIGRAIQLRVPLCVGEFTSGASRTIAERLGFEVLSEIPYEEFALETSQQRPFENCEPGNYSIALMAVSIALPEVQQAASPVSPSTEKSRKVAKSRKKK